MAVSLGWWHRDFRLLWIGETVSKLGSNVTTVALPLVAVLFVSVPIAALTGLLTFGQLLVVAFGTGFFLLAVLVELTGPVRGTSDLPQ